MTQGKTKNILTIVSCHIQNNEIVTQINKFTKDHIMNKYIHLE